MISVLLLLQKNDVEVFFEDVERPPQLPRNNIAAAAAAAGGAPGAAASGAGAGNAAGGAAGGAGNVLRQ
jgi:hypothetical protein